MEDATEIFIFTALGVAFAVGLAVLARWAGKNPVRLAAYALLAVSFLYVGFGLRSEAPNTWVAIEMTGVAVFGSLAFLSMISSPWFVVVGLALHPLWAISFHYLGTGSSFTPAPFALANAGFDGALALYVAYTIWRQRGAKTSSAGPESSPRTAPRAANANSKSEKGRAQ